MAKKRANLIRRSARVGYGVTNLSIPFAGTTLVPFATFARNHEPHHSTSETYDLTKPNSLKGRVTGVVWVNPHVSVLMEVRKADGSTEAWALELGAPNQLLSAGWKKSDLSVGDQIAVTAFAPRSGAKTDQTWAIPRDYPPSEMMDLYKKAAELKSQGRMAHCSDITLASGRKLTYQNIWQRP